MTSPASDESEWRTHKRLIDPRLCAAGWKVTKYDPAHPFGKGSPVAIEEFLTDNGPADCTHCTEGTLLGVIEAKKPTQMILAGELRGKLAPNGADLHPVRLSAARVPGAEARPYEPASALLARIRSTQPDKRLCGERTRASNGARGRKWRDQ